MNKKFILLLFFLPLFVAGCRASSIPYLNKVLPKETVTKIVFQQNEKIDSLANFAKRADALAKEKWAPDATLKTISFSNINSFIAYVAQFTSDQIKTKDGKPGDLSVYYNYASTGVIDMHFNGLQENDFSEKDNSLFTGVSCVKSDLCGNNAVISQGEKINPGNFKITSTDVDKCLESGKVGTIIVKINDIPNIPKGSVIMQCGRFRLDAYTGQEIITETASSTPNPSLNNPATSTPVIATSTQKISTSSQPAIDLNKDSDNDGLSDWQEERYGTNLNNPDTDSDGYKDGAEVAGGYNPLGSGKMTAAQLEIKKEIANKLAQTSSIILYTSVACPRCQGVETFLNDNKVEEKIKFLKKEILDDKSIAAEMVAKGAICKISTSELVAPLLWDGEKCFLGPEAVIKFFQDKLAGISPVSSVYKPLMPPKRPEISEVAPDCTGITSGTLKMDNSAADKQLYYCCLKTLFNNCGNFELTYNRSDLGAIKFTTGVKGKMCELRFDFGPANQITDQNKKFYADKYVTYSIDLVKFNQGPHGSYAYDFINPATLAEDMDSYIEAYRKSKAGFSGNIDKTLMTDAPASSVSQRDAQRVADILQIQTALELYYNDAGQYPSMIIFGGPLKDSAGKTIYFSEIPKNPLPNDGACSADFAFKYEVMPNDKTNYKLTYCLGRATQHNSETIPAGINIATPVGMTGGK